MSVEILPRQRGAIVRCGNGALEGADDCSESYMTGQIQAGLVRSAAKAVGWGRSEVRRFKRVDLCPRHVAADKERTKERRRVRCGHENCTACFEGTGPKDKRRQAKRAGWGKASKRGRGRRAKEHDLCPEHLAEEHRRVAALTEERPKKAVAAFDEARASSRVHVDDVAPYRVDGALAGQVGGGS